MKSTLLSTLFFFVSFFSIAQTSSLDPVDVQGWYGVGLGIDFPKKWTTVVGYQARFQNNLASYKGSYISFSGAKLVSKQVELVAEYRFAKVENTTYHRFSGGAEYSPKVKRIDLGFRILVLNNIQDFFDPTRANKKSAFWRARVKTAYKLTKNWDGYLSTEPVMEFGATNIIDNWRNTIGFKRKIAPGVKLDIYYMYRPDYSKASYNRTFHVLGLNIDFKVKPKKKLK